MSQLAEEMMNELVEAAKERMPITILGIEYRPVEPPADVPEWPNETEWPNGRRAHPEPAAPSRQEPEPAPCPKCDARWEATGIVSEASKGGGYHLRCHACGHEWDDKNASHNERETARRKGSRQERTDRTDIERVVQLAIDEWATVAAGPDGHHMTLAAYIATRVRRQSGEQA